MRATYETLCQEQNNGQKAVCDARTPKQGRTCENGTRRVYENATEYERTADGTPAETSQGGPGRYGAFVTGLIRSALGILLNNEPEERTRALWRLTDAGGLLADSLKRDRADGELGEDVPTGLGYLVVCETTPGRTGSTADGSPTHPGGQNSWRLGPRDQVPTTHEFPRNWRSGGQRIKGRPLRPIRVNTTQPKGV